MDSYSSGVGARKDKGLPKIWETHQRKHPPKPPAQVITDSSSVFGHLGTFNIYSPPDPDLDQDNDQEIQQEPQPESHLESQSLSLPGSLRNSLPGSYHSSHINAVQRSSIHQNQAAASRSENRPSRSENQQSRSENRSSRSENQAGSKVLVQGQGLTPGPGSSSTQYESVFSSLMNLYNPKYQDNDEESSEEYFKYKYYQ